MNFEDACKIVASMDNASARMLARILNSYGHGLSDACSNGVHNGPGVRYCTYKNCACDCHLTLDQYLYIHGVARPV